MNNLQATFYGESGWVCERHNYDGQHLGLTHDTAAEGSAEDGPTAHALTMTRPPNKTIIAEIFDVETGRELRIRYGDEQNLLDSLLSRTGDGPLEERAAEFRAVLLEEGWTER